MSEWCSHCFLQHKPWPSYTGPGSATLSAGSPSCWSVSLVCHYRCTALGCQKHFGVWWSGWSSYYCYVNIPCANQSEADVSTVHWMAILAFWNLWYQRLQIRRIFPRPTVICQLPGYVFVHCFISTISYEVFLVVHWWYSRVCTQTDMCAQSLTSFGTVVLWLVVHFPNLLSGSLISLEIPTSLKSILIFYHVQSLQLSHWWHGS